MFSNACRKTDAYRKWTCLDNSIIKTSSSPFNSGSFNIKNNIIDWPQLIYIWNRATAIGDTFKADDCCICNYRRGVGIFGLDWLWYLKIMTFGAYWAPLCVIYCTVIKHKSSDINRKIYHIIYGHVSINISYSVVRTYCTSIITTIFYTYIKRIYWLSI